MAAELERNVWFMAEPLPGSSVASLALAPLPAVEAPALGSREVAALSGGEQAGGALLEPRPPSWLRDAMWSSAMAQLGGEFKELACFPGEHSVVWEHMQAPPQHHHRRGPNARGSSRYC